MGETFEDRQNYDLRKKCSPPKYQDVARYKVNSAVQIFMAVETVLATVATLLLLGIVCGLPFGKLGAYHRRQSFGPFCVH